MIIINNEKKARNLKWDNENVAYLVPSGDS